MEEFNIRKNFVVNAVFSPLLIFSKNLGFFSLITGVFAIISVILAFIFGQTYACRYDLPTEGLFCYAWGWVPYIFLKLIFLSVFAQIWYVAIYEHQKIDKNLLLSYWRAYLRNFAVLCGFIIINFIPVISMALLIMREPNPNWLIEVGYFTVVALGFATPFILMRFYGLVADLIAGNGWKNAGKIWWEGYGKGLKYVLSSAIIFMICVILFVGIVNFLRIYLPLSSMVGNFLYDLAVNFLTCLDFVIVIGYFEAIRQQLLNVDENI